MSSHRAIVSMANNTDAYCWSALIICFLSVLMGPDNRVKEHPACLKALSDFVFVGSGVYDALSVPEHGMKARPLPLRLQAGYQYVFHLPKPGDLDVYQKILTQLQSDGVSITSSSDDMDRYLGGPGFRISFQEKGCKGVILNKLDGQIMNSDVLIKKWSLDDYILVIEET